jgi:hypothetical protein
MDINLALFYNPKDTNVADIATIGERLDPGIRLRAYSTADSHLLTPLRLLTRPSVTIELSRPRHFHPIGVKRLRQLRKGKTFTNRVLQEAGVSVPKFEVISRETVLDPAVWGPYVVVKPDEGGRGAYVRIHRTGRVRYKEPSTLRKDHPGRHCAMMAEQFIYTGPWPVSHRVLTLFGEPILSLRYEAPHDIPALPSSGDFKSSGGGRTIVATRQGCAISLYRDDEMLEIARRVHALFPEVPLLGQDLVRDAITGKIYVIEINPNGQTWAFTNRSGLAMQAQFQLDFYQQFDALNTTARVFSDVARRHAK